MYDIIIIGAGAAGLTSAFTALGFGKKVLIIEKNKSGGECTWSGCIPSKSLINIAKDFYIAKKYSPIKIDSNKILKKVRLISENIYKEESPDILKKAGADYIKGDAKFKTSNTVDVNGIEYKAKKVIIASGSSPFIPPIDGINNINYLTNENFFQQDSLPDSIIVLGGGAIGLELSQAMNRLGVKVTLVEMMNNILFREEKDLSLILKNNLEKEGINFLLKTKAIKVEENNNKIYLTVENDNKSKIISADKILIAVGRKSNFSGMNLEKIGMNLEKGIKVNKYLETNIKGIYACGDVVGPYLLSHMANYQGKLAALNAILPIKKTVNYKNTAWCTFTSPEFARAGLSEEEAKKTNKNIKVYNYSFDSLDRAKTKENDIGEIKIICDKKGRILGAHILAERAGEIISEVQTLKTLNISLAKLQGVIHPYPTYSDSLRQIAQKVYLDQILENPIIKIIKKITTK